MKDRVKRTRKKHKGIGDSKRRGRHAQRRRSYFYSVVSRRKKYAKIVKASLENIGKVILWSDNFFRLGESTLENLCKQAAGFDYAVVLYTKDDHAVVRKKQCFTARDNVLFEHGIFTGVLSRYRTFALIQKD